MSKLQNPKHLVKVALVGKYVELPDAYKSIIESFIHAGAKLECKVNLVSIHSETIDEHNYLELLKDFQGIVVAPGFGERGIEGKILAARYARENNIHYFGIIITTRQFILKETINIDCYLSKLCATLCSECLSG